MKHWLVAAAAAVLGDLLRDVSLLEHVDAVVKGGQLVKGPAAAR